MTSNNTDWRFGETNGQYIEEQAQADANIKAGDPVKLDSAGGDGHLPRILIWALTILQVLLSLNIMWIVGLYPLCS